MKKNKTFNIQIKVDALVSISINASSLEEALASAKEDLKNTDIFLSDVELIDVEKEITGIY